MLYNDIYIYNDRDFLGVPGSKGPVSVGSPDLFVNIGGVAIYVLDVQRAIDDTPLGVPSKRSRENAMISHWTKQSSVQIC